MAAKDRNKDSEMAKRLKAWGVVRKTLKCPVCYRTVRLEAFPGHIWTAGGAKEEK